VTEASKTTQHVSFRGEARSTLRLAGPVVVAQLGMMTMGLVDILMVGPLGAEALAAVSLGNALFFALLIFCGGVLMALDTLVSQAVGAGEAGRAGALLWQGAWLALVLGLGLNLLFLDVEWVLVLLRQPEEVVGPTGDYLWARSFSAVPFLAFAACRGLLNGIGDTRPVMIVTLVANVVNLLADAVLIHGLLGAPALGVLGAGVATSVVRWFMLGAIVWVLRDPRYRRYDLSARRPGPAEVWRIFRLGLPIGAQFLVEVGLFSATGILVGWLGAIPLARHQIALTCASFTFMVPLGLGVAATVRVGHAVGRGDPVAAMIAGRAALALGLLSMIVPSLVFLLAPSLLARAFTADPEVIAGAATLLRIAAVFQLADGLQAVAAGCLRGAGDLRAPLVANLVSHWVVGLPLGAGLAFGLGWGTAGLWWGLTVALTLVALILAWRFLRGGWRRLSRLA
jgi:multidrug resistance protein, MATE family